eukprot:g3876.t1
MADLTRQTRLRLMEEFNQRAKENKIISIKGLRSSYEPILKEFDDLSLKEFRETVELHEKKIRGNLKRMDLNVYVGSHTVTEKDEYAETAREVFRKFADTHRCGDVWVEAKVVEKSTLEIPHGIDAIVQGAITMMWNVSNAQNVAKKKAKLGVEKLSEHQDLGARRKTQWYVGHCRGFVDLQGHISDRIKRMVGPDAFQLEMVAVTVTRGDIMPAFEVAFGPTVHCPIMRIPYAPKSEPAEHEKYKRNEVEFQSYVKRNAKTKDAEEDDLDRVEVTTERMMHTLDVYASALSSAVGTLNLRAEISQPPRDDLAGGPGEKKKLPNFSGRWWIESSEGLDEYLKAMGMGRIKRGIITAKSSFTQDIKQVRDIMTLKIVGHDKECLVGPFQLGSYDVVKMTDIVGDEVMMSTKWNGDVLMETQKGPRGTAECSRFLQRVKPKGRKSDRTKKVDGKNDAGDEVKMILEYMFEGTVMKQTYKRIGKTTIASDSK